MSPLSKPLFINQFRFDFIKFMVPIIFSMPSQSKFIHQVSELYIIELTYKVLHRYDKIYEKGDRD